ncbi:hypothetical protein D9756_000845 [Leucocoprinus leucothites]|uniref:Uncharacterized protein n=1 Tax=Leucocoprinus leucothites TaxID=201217 RepID=A0A8H5LNM9_9AGAR|nr:hypothetical protein D9756_000845 [Leucoagaricus leucothites]
MTLSSASRSLPLRLSRSFTTSPSCRNSQIPAEPQPPRRKGRIPRVNPKTQSLLPPEKMRALISLYHQSDEIITMENLNDHIDAAFQKPRQVLNSISQYGLDQLVKDQRSAPRMAPWNQDTVSQPGLQTPGTSWSSVMSSRERQIVDALCGVETHRKSGNTLPGYGTLMESMKRKRQQQGDRTL